MSSDRCPSCGAYSSVHWTEEQVLDGYRNSPGYFIVFFDEDGQIRYDMKNLAFPAMDMITGILFRLAIQVVLEHTRIKSRKESR